MFFFSSTEFLKTNKTPKTHAQLARQHGVSGTREAKKTNSRKNPIEIGMEIQHITEQRVFESPGNADQRLVHSYPPRTHKLFTKAAAYEDFSRVAYSRLTFYIWVFSDKCSFFGCGLTLTENNPNAQTAKMKTQDGEGGRERGKRGEERARSLCNHNIQKTSTKFLVVRTDTYLFSSTLKFRSCLA